MKRGYNCSENHREGKGFNFRMINLISSRLCEGDFRIPYRTEICQTKFLTDKIFRQTKFSIPCKNFDNFVRRIILSDEFLSEILIWCNLCFCSILDKNNKETT